MGLVPLRNRDFDCPVIAAGWMVGVHPGPAFVERIWLVSFMQYNLGYSDDETCRLEPIENPFSRKVLRMSPE